MKNIFPNQLIQRPAQAANPPREVRVGDHVTLLPADGSPPVRAKVRQAIALFGCTTYTADPAEADAAHSVPGHVATRFRFRWQDVHHLEPA